MSDGAIEGWIDYGRALNEGRALFKGSSGDLEFGKWMKESNLWQVAGGAVEDHERAAAMWAAANTEQLAEARAANNARTLRELHAKWNEIVAERGLLFSTSTILLCDPQRPS